MAGELITADGQVEWGGIVLGDGTIYGVQREGITGWEDLPDVSTGNVPRPLMHGSWPGRALAGERVVTARGQIVEPPGGLQSALAALRAATTVGDEQTLTIRTLSETLLAYGRVTQRAITPDYGIGHASFAIQWTCADPLKYSTTEKHARAELSGAGLNGLVYPLVYPLTYGPDPSTASSTTCVNSLDTDTAPLLVVQGPIEGPLIVNLLTQVQLEFDIILTASDILTINCRTGEVLLNGAADRLYTRTAASAPVELFTVTNGSNPISLRALAWSAGNSLDIWWRDATL